MRQTDRQTYETGRQMRQTDETDRQTYETGRQMRDR